MIYFIGGDWSEVFIIICLISFYILISQVLAIVSQISQSEGRRVRKSAD